MPTTRRRFIQISALAGAAATLGAPAALSSAFARPLQRKGLRILILGGTGFLGPETVTAAVERGHTVTIFNRGATEERRKDAGRPSKVPDGVEVLYGNRDPEKTADDWKPPAERDPASPKGLDALKGREWDAVIDNSGFVPRIVRASAELLGPSVKQYVFISSVSVYADNSKPGQDETAAVGQMSDPAVEEMGASFENYGPLKALCEQAAEAAMPGRVANVRPGYIVGPGDTSMRFTYWPARAALARTPERRGVLVPGKAEDPVQIIDVRDLAEWLVTLVEQRTVGVFNAVGPANKLSAGEMLNACALAAGTEPQWVFVPQDKLIELGVQPGELPIIMPPEGEYAGFHQWSNARALAAGLRFRTVADTAKATLEWYDSLADSPAPTAPGADENSERDPAAPANLKEFFAQRFFPAQREREAIEAWMMQGSSTKPQ